MSAAVLEVDNLSRAFGGVQAVDRVSFTLRPGEIVGLIGPNGAGKTTLVNLITGVVTAGSGTVRFEGHDVTRQRPWQAARRGLARTFQVVQPFPEMTVLDNVAAGALFAGHAENRAEAEAAAREHLAFVGLVYEAHRPAASLPLPGRKRLELAKSLAMKPKVLLLDEPAAGVPQDESGELFAVIANLSKDISVLFIEHDMNVVFRFASRIIVMVGGRVLVEGTPAEIAADARVREVYLGQSHGKVRHG